MRAWGIACLALILLGILGSHVSVQLRPIPVVSAKGGLEFGSKMRDSRPSPAILTFRAPHCCALTGVVPFSARRTFDIASDGREFRLLVPDGKIMRFFVGPVDAPPISSNPRENLRPKPIVDALHWFPAKLVSAAALGGSGNGGVCNSRSRRYLSNSTPCLLSCSFSSFLHAAFL